MKLTRKELRSLIREAYLGPKYGYECDPYIKMLVVVTDPGSAEESR